MDQCRRWIDQFGWCLCVGGLGHAGNRRVQDQQCVAALFRASDDRDLTGTPEDLQGLRPELKVK